MYTLERRLASWYIHGDEPVPFGAGKKKDLLPNFAEVAKEVLLNSVKNIRTPPIADVKTAILHHRARCHGDKKPWMTLVEVRRELIDRGVLRPGGSTSDGSFVSSYINRYPELKEWHTTPSDVNEYKSGADCKKEPKPVDPDAERRKRERKARAATKLAEVQDQQLAEMFNDAIKDEERMEKVGEVTADKIHSLLKEWIKRVHGFTDRYGMYKSCIGRYDDLDTFGLNDVYEDDAALGAVITTGIYSLEHRIQLYIQIIYDFSDARPSPRMKGTLQGILDTWAQYSVALERQNDFGEPDCEKHLFDINYIDMNNMMADLRNILRRDETREL
jgi:hypothetical protein